METFPHRVIATIPEAILPVDRGAKYADPLAVSLRAARCGELRGEGSQLGADGRVLSVDIELALTDLGPSIDLVRRTLIQCGAPRGSTITYQHGAATRAIWVDSGEPFLDSDAVDRIWKRRLLSSGAVPVEYSSERVRKLAHSILASYRKLTDSLRYEPIDRSAYDASAFEWYDAVSQALELVGFTNLADLRIAVDSPKLQRLGAPFARRLVSQDGLHRAEVFEIRNAMGKLTRAITLVAEFSDGRFISTSTAPQRWNVSERVRRVQMLESTSVSTLVEEHVGRQRAYAMQHPQAGPVTFPTLEALLASDGRLWEANAAHRREQGVPSIEELIRIGTEPTLAKLVHAEMLELKAGAGR